MKIAALVESRPQDSRPQADAPIANPAVPMQPQSSSVKYKEALLVFLMSLAFLLTNISTTGSKIFDEIIYVPAAESLLHHQPDSNPEHPPMGKYLIGAGIWMAGDNPVGWRLMSAVFGSLLVAAAFLWMWKLGRHVAWSAVLLIATNGFWFVLSRVAMLSIFEVTFTVIALYLLTERSYLFAGAAVGLAAACRWNALFALLLAIVYLLCGHGGLNAAIKTAAASAAAYVLTWIPIVGLHPVNFLQAQLYILHFHLRASGNPTINDNWYHWAFHTVPERGIYSLLANPIITVLGVLAILILWRRGNIVALAATVFLLQWAVTPRPFVYYYYYLDTIIMMSIAIAIVSGYAMTLGSHQLRLCVPIVVLSAAWFLTRYPAFTALQSPWDTLFRF